MFERKEEKGEKMQYKDSPKLMIDERKLEILFRLGCPDAKIIELLKTKTFTPTGDKLIDDTLECLIDNKQFDSRGGNHNPYGKNQHNKDEFAQSGQNGGQNGGQTIDSNIYNIPDNNYIYNNIQDNNILSGIKEEIKKEILKEKKQEESISYQKDNQDRTLEIQFNAFWTAFPKQRKAGKTKPRQKFIQIIKSKQATPEQLIKAAEDYAQTDEVIRGYAKEPYSWLLNERYLCDYTTKIRAVPQMSYKDFKQVQNEIELEKIRKGEK